MENQHKSLISRFKYLTEILNREVTGESRMNLAQKLFEEIPDATDFEDIPKVVLSNSENVGGPRLTRKNSRKFVGDVPGFESSVRLLSKQKANEKFKELLNKFMRF